MTAEMVAIEQDMPGADQLTDAELSRMSTLIESVIADVRMGTEYPGFTVTYDEATNTATWNNLARTLEAKATAQNGVHALTLSQKLTDEAGFNVMTTSVAIAGSEARMTKSNIRDTGLEFKKPTTEPLDRTTYDTQLENLVAIKTTGAEEARPLPRRRLPFGWMRSIIRR